MAKFSNNSKIKLRSCDEKLQLLFNVVIQNFDCTIIDGYRSNIEQNRLFLEKKSKLSAGKSKHNTNPSKAIDVAPYIAGKGLSFDLNQCYFFAGYVIRIAEELGITLRWGGDWDSDGNLNDQSFNDLVHFELLGE